MNKGYISIHRQIKEWEHWNDISCRWVFIELLLSAQWKDSNVDGISVPRGSVMTSVRRLSNETGLSFQSVRSALKRMEKTSTIRSKTTTKNTIISILKYKK